MNFFRNVTIMCCLASFLFGVTISEIKNDEQYLWGEGRNTIPARANKQALKQLVSQVSLQVESKFTSIVQEQGEDIGDYTEVILNTYSNVMLNEARQLESRNNGVSHVLRYITKKN